MARQNLPNNRIQILCSRAYRLLSAVASSTPFRCDPTASWLNSSREPQSSQSERPGEPMARAPLFPFAIDHRLPRLPGCRRPEGRLLLPSLPAWAWLRRSLAARPRSFSSRPTAEPLLRSFTHSAAAAARLPPRTACCGALRVPPASPTLRA